MQLKVEKSKAGYRSFRILKVWNFNNPDNAYIFFQMEGKFVFEYLSLSKKNTWIKNFQN